MYFFTADAHYGHAKVLEYENRPLSSVEEMDEELIHRHNTVVRSKDTVIHAGDFAFCKILEQAEKYISNLSGKQVFLYGSHDNWLGPHRASDIYTEQVNKQLIVICHYAMRVWPRSHYGSWHLYGHTTASLNHLGKVLILVWIVIIFIRFTFNNLRSYLMNKHIAMEMNCPGWIEKIIKNKDEIQAKEAVRTEFEKLVEGLELPLSERVAGESHLFGDCREFRRLSLFVKYHSTYHVQRGGCGLCSKRHWLATWCILPGHFEEEIEIAEQVAKDFDRRYPYLSILSMPYEWWQI